MEIWNKPYNLFLLTSAFVGAVTFVLFFSDKSVDIQYHDTYFVVAQWHYTFAFSVLFLLFWVMYKAAYRILYSINLIRVHVFITLICFGAYFILDLYLSYNAYQYRSYSIESIKAFKYFSYLNTIYDALIIILLLAQFVFIINLIIGLLNKLYLKYR